MFEPDYPIENLRGAEYNPRSITRGAELQLQASIEKVGFAKPVLVTASGVIIAGHQRTNAARAIRRRTVPAYVIRDLELGHEMRFNQIHNGVDVDLETPVRVPPSKALGFVDVNPEDIECDFQVAGAPLRQSIYTLISRYGPWGACIATEAGEVLASQQYAITSKLALAPLRVFYVPKKKKRDVLHYFGQQYGEFFYEKLPRNPWIQSYAQPGRQRRPGEDASSQLYDRDVFPQTKPGERLLDFGCGLGQMLQAAKRRGIRALGIEFFFKGPTDSIKPTVVHRMIDEVCEELRTRGLFDVVVADSVVNSVDTVQAEADVLTCLNALCRPGGRIYFSGRSQNLVEAATTRTAQRYKQGGRRRVEFVDANGFSANPRGDRWFFQKFHNEAEVEALAAKFIGPGCAVRHGSGAIVWSANGVKTMELPKADVRESLQREFDLAWPEGRSVGRGDAIVEAYERATRSKR